MATNPIPGHQVRTGSVSRIVPTIPWELALKRVNGVVFAARQIGANLPRGFHLTDGTFAAFQRAVLQITDESLRFPLMVVAWAALENKPSDKKVFSFPDHLDLDKTLETALSLLTWRLEDAAHYDPKAAEDRFSLKTWNDNWARARDAAAKVEAGLEVAIKVGNESVDRIGEPSPVSLTLVGTNGSLVPVRWTTFYIKKGTLGEDQAFARSEVPAANILADLGRSAFAKLFPETRTEAPAVIQAQPFAETIFTKAGYPNRDVVARAEVHHILGVVPYPEGIGRLQFVLNVPMLETQALLEVITGEGWHTKHGQFSFDAAPDELSQVSVPNVFGSSNFFKAQSDADISARRARQAGLTGEVVSKRIVVVLKPAISPSLAALHCDILNIDTLSVFDQQSLGDRLVKLLAQDPMYLDRLLGRGLITPPQLDKLGELVSAARQRTAERERVESGLRFEPSESLLLMRGGLNTGVGDHAGRLGVTDEVYAPDPFLPPVVYVFIPGVWRTTKTSSRILMPAESWPIT